MHAVPKIALHEKKEERQIQNVFECLSLDRTSDWNWMEVNYKTDPLVLWLYKETERG